MSSVRSIDSLFDLIDARRDEIIALTQDLIRIPTTNPPGENYEPCAREIGTRLATRGFDVSYIRGEGTPGDSTIYPRINVVARYETGRPGPCVHFNGHIDVVEAGKGWTLDPFGGEARDGRVYGRGAADMKGGIAAAIIAVEALLDSGIALQGAIEISGTVDEESGGFGGVAYLAERGWFSRPRVDHVIIPEPLNVDRVCIGHRGVWWAEIETKGRMAHGSMPFFGDCAVRHMGAVIEAFEDKLFPALGRVTTAMPIMPVEARQSTLNINSVHGGQAELENGLPAPCVPDSCRMIIDRRFLVEEDLAGVKDEVRHILDELAQTRPGFSYALRDLFDVIPSMTDRNAPVVRMTAAAVERVLGKPATFVCSPGSYDQKHIDRIGKLKDCIAYGPGIVNLAHQPDEYVEIDDLLNAAKVMALTTLNLLTGQA